MKFAIKKEFLLKHQFWLLLASAFPFMAGALFVLVAILPAATNEKRDKVKKKLDAISVPHPPKDLKNDAVNAKIKDMAEKTKAQEETVWKNAYNKQAKDLYFWPAELEKKFHYSGGLFAEIIRINGGKKSFDGLPKDERNFVHGRVTAAPTEADGVVEIQLRSGKRIKIVPTKDVRILQAGGDKSSTVPEKKGGRLTFDKIPVNSYISVFGQVGKFFGDPLSDAERAVYRKKYQTQLASIVRQIQPVYVEDEVVKGVVQLPNWTDAPLEDDDEFAKEIMKKLAKNRDSSKVTMQLSGEGVGSRAGYLYFLNQEEIPSDRDFSEDVWIAQEDLWIQNEIYGLIRTANDYVSKFKKESNGKQEKNREYVFRNPYWKLTLKLEGADKLLATFENQLPRGQKLNFWLVLTTYEDLTKLKKEIDDSTATITVDKSDSLAKESVIMIGGEQMKIVSFEENTLTVQRGVNGTTPAKHAARAVVALLDRERLPDGKDKDGKDLEPPQTRVKARASKKLKKAEEVERVEFTLKKPSTKRKILSVEQELTWETAAVRRLDGIYISTLGNGQPIAHRQYPQPLLAYPKRGGDDKKDEKPVVPPPNIPVKGRPDPKADKAAPALTLLGQTRERYTELAATTIDGKQHQVLRRLPVAVALIVEQSHVDRVQTAFNNSKLRFLTSQVVMSHYAESVRPKLTTGASPAREAPKGFNFPPPNQSRPDASSAGGGGGDELEANVELVIYGTITIYERVPVRVQPPADLK